MKSLRPSQFVSKKLLYPARETRYNTASLPALTVAAYETGIILEVETMAWGVGEKKLDIRKGPGGKVVPLGVKDIAGGAAKMEKKTQAQRNLAGGMDLLELDFLLGIVENTNGEDKNDVSMRKLSFNEVLRRSQQNEVDSNSLVLYAVDEKGRYGKDIQCAAIKELAHRTEHKGS